MIKEKCIFIDQGHGGKDPGAVGPKGTKESDINLLIGKAIKEKLESLGAKVKTSRDDDSYLSVTDRISLANSSNADVFISIHCNSAGQIAEGIETWYHGKSHKGRILAEKIHKFLVINTKSKDRKTKNDLLNERFRNGIPVLAKTSMPAILIETEFINNPKIEEKMLTKEWQEQVANAVVTGLVNYFEEL